MPASRSNHAPQTITINKVPDAWPVIGRCFAASANKCVAPIIQTKNDAMMITPSNTPRGCHRSALSQFP